MMAKPVGDMTAKYFVNHAVVWAIKVQCRRFTPFATGWANFILGCFVYIIFY